MDELPTVKSGPRPVQNQHLAGPNLKNVRNIIAVSSGKGGVGKSTVTVNIAMGLARKGYSVGLMDGDVYGPSIPKMLDGFSQPEQKDGKLLPVERYGIKFISMALLMREDSPVIWRGPMASKLIQTFLSQVEWGELDYLLIDLPPGTGDVQLTLTQAAPLTGAVIVTTPQEVAINVTMRGIKMFDEVQVPILGVVENMSGFMCSHCGEETSIFRQGGGEKTAKNLGYTFLGRIPLDPQLALASDIGSPLEQNRKNESDAAKAFEQITGRLIHEIENIQEKNETTVIEPTKIDTKENRVWIAWSDGVESLLEPKELRYLCPCAQCVDENTGKRIIQKENIKEDTHAIGFRPVGKYGVQISWSDGHNTGIYTYNRLREF